eukprot:TRINITY_DN34140_c0_g1_i1.p1 TRINITY_DN34140_c0_g1~~TRINITY_DN34140_c0_g1_i1.p1  ORF type:complete len:391 (-),score=107.51 TRINITY_DN34140_c0_g1_i1:50-1222(-)
MSTEPTSEPVVVAEEQAGATEVWTALFKRIKERPQSFYTKCEEVLAAQDIFEPSDFGDIEPALLSTSLQQGGATAGVIAFIEQAAQLHKEPHGATAALGPVSAAACEELQALQELLERTTAAREAMHKAVHTCDVEALRAVLRPETAELLLKVEVDWARAELSILDGSMGQVALVEEEKDAEEAKRAREAGSEAKRQLMREEEAARARRELQAAIEAEDYDKLVATLKEKESLLEPSEIAEAARKIPGIKARSNVRKELNWAMKNPSDLTSLKFIISLAKKSRLPQAEVDAAEAVLNEALEARKRPKAQEADPPKVVEPEVPSMEMLLAELDAPIEEIIEPETELEFAYVAKDRPRVEAALRELRSFGYTAFEISQQRARAEARFGKLGS